MSWKGLSLNGLWGTSFVALAVIIHSYLRLVFFRHGFDLSHPLLLVRVPFVEAWAVLLFVHTDIGIEGLSLFIDHVFEIKCATVV